MDIGKSSPRPWSYIHSQPGRPIWKDQIIDADGEVLADTIGEADGLLIVAAVNAYDPKHEEAFEAMREALEAVKKDCLDRADKDGNVPIGASSWILLRDAVERAALVATEKQEGAQ